MFAGINIPCYNFKTMKPHLIFANPQRCTGCGLCSLHAYPLLKGLGVFSLALSPIIVQRSSPSTGYYFTVHFDEALSHELYSLVKVCPRGCFSWQEGSKDE